MKVKVVSTKPLSIEGKPDVKGLELTFEHEGQTKTLSTWIPPVVTAAGSWQPGQEVEIEEYSKDGKPPRFRLPNQGKAFGGGARFQPDPQRNALEAAVSLAQTAWRIPDSGSERGGPGAQGAADAMLAFVENAVPRILRAISGGAAVDSASAPAAATVRSPAAGPGGGEDVNTPSNDGTPSPAGNGAFTRKPEDCPHERLEDAPRAGFKQCPSCGAGGPARWFEAEDSSRKTKTPLAKEKAPSA